MFDLRSLAVDAKKSTEGVWVDFLGTGIELKIARHNNRRAENARAAALYEFYRQLKDSKDSEDMEEKLRQVQAQVLSEHILVDWKGIALDGEPLEYSEENAMKLLGDPDFEDFYQFVVSESSRRENFERENEVAVVADVKTSASS